MHHAPGLHATSAMTKLSGDEPIRANKACGLLSNLPQRASYSPRGFDRRLEREVVAVPITSFCVDLRSTSMAIGSLAGNVSFSASSSSSFRCSIAAGRSVRGCFLSMSFCPVRLCSLYLSVRNSDQRAEADTMPRCARSLARPSLWLARQAGASGSGRSTRAPACLTPRLPHNC